MNITCRLGAPTRHVIWIPDPAYLWGEEMGGSLLVGGSQLPSEPWLWLGGAMISLGRELSWAEHQQSQGTYHVPCWRAKKARDLIDWAFGWKRWVQPSRFRGTQFTSKSWIGLGGEMVTMGRELLQPAQLSALSCSTHITCLDGVPTGLPRRRRGMWSRIVYGPCYSEYICCTFYDLNTTLQSDLTCQNGVVNHSVNMTKHVTTQHLPFKGKGSSLSVYLFSWSIW